MIIAMTINTHAEIELITLGFAFIHEINFFARTAYPIRDKKSKSI